ncbi:DoxX family protein [Cellulomonas sp. SLBN-39]|uniref:DoxX family protein n=1 Tax=Cellulomonas sp. SLBN-39 TaxID=2768446 RepID=UPI001150BA9B|nr:DoxX family protein [Cellulomonas sp. SLBN-39]TQL02202.1 DoxX-like protein [Cellulomonas sp. SLBN-39]
MPAVAHIVLSVLLAALLLTTGGGKIAGSASSHAIRDSLHVPPGRWRAIGAFEGVVVAALVLGIWVPLAGVAAAGGVVLLMAGAIVTRLRAGGAQQRSGVTADVVVLLIALVTLVLAVVAHA